MLQGFFAGSKGFLRCLLRFDRDLADKAREGGCQVCQGALHVANFPRKPRGLPEEVEKDLELRFSLCCSRDGCRKRLTPASLRFLSRRVYWGAFVVLISAMVGGASPLRCRRLRALFDVDVRTLRRWRIWWREEFSKTAVGAEILASLSGRTSAGEEKPRSFLRVLGRSGLPRALVKLLHRLLPLSGWLPPGGARISGDLLVHAEDACRP